MVDQKIQKWLFSALVFIFLALVATGFYLLFISRSGAALLSPWQTINHAYIYVFAAATLLMGVLILFKSENTRLVLGLLVVHTFLLHSYLPITQELFYGADGWRHMANEARLLEGLPFKEAILSTAMTLDNKNVEILISHVGKLSYVQFWWLLYILAKVTSLSLVVITAWLMPVVWSVVFPLLFYTLGRTLGMTKQWALFLVWISLLPFALQTAGSFTLPVNVSFLLWLGTVVLLLRVGKQSKIRVAGLVTLGTLLTFGYPLFAVLFWLTLLIFFVNTKIKGLTMWHLLYSVAIGLVLPALEVVSRYSSFDYNLNLFKNFKQMIGNFSGAYLTFGPRPHDISPGNILFNQVPSYAFIPNLFTQHRLWLVCFAVGFFVMVGYGTYTALQNDRLRIFATLAIALTMSYAISWYGLVGEHIFTRRLDVVLAAVYIILAVVALRRLSLQVNWGPGTKFGAVLILSVAIATSYSLGPDTSAVSVDEYQAMQYVWSYEKTNQRHCVMADTYPLLTLEAISKKEIIGGGFPIGSNFEQPELKSLWLAAHNGGGHPYPTWSKLYELTGGSYCFWVISPSNRGVLLPFDAFHPLPGDEKIFGKVSVWKFDSTNFRN